MQLNLVNCCRQLLRSKTKKTFHIFEKRKEEEEGEGFAGFVYGFALKETSLSAFKTH